MCIEHWVVYGCKCAKVDFTEQCEDAKKLDTPPCTRREAGPESRASMCCSSECCRKIGHLHGAAYQRAIRRLFNIPNTTPAEVEGARYGLMKKIEGVMKVHEECKAHYNNA